MQPDIDVDSMHLRTLFGKWDKSWQTTDARPQMSTQTSVPGISP